VAAESGSRADQGLCVETRQPGSAVRTAQLPMPVSLKGDGALSGSLYLLPQDEAPAGEAADGKTQAGQNIMRSCRRVLASLAEGADLSAVHTWLLRRHCVTRFGKFWAHGRRLISVYGPTEGTVCATMHECNPEESGEPPSWATDSEHASVHLGRAWEPVPAGVVGELYIGGPG